MSASRAEAEIEHAKRNSRADVEILNDRIDRLTLLCEAMWTVLRESGHADDARLWYAFHELDASDGAYNGKKAKRAATCAGCEAAVPVNSAICQFCGAQAPPRPLFDTV